jgi:hypothetical protein
VDDVVDPFVSRRAAVPRVARSAGRARSGRLSRRLGAAVMLGVALGSSVACGSQPVTPAAADAVTTPPPPPPVYWPLTGLESGQVAAHPALAVKIENSVDARPQTGLDSADMVWEEVVEGGITRYVAVFHSTLPPEIGPIRSVRPMDPAIAAPLGGLLAFSGGQRPFVAAVADARLQVVSHDAGSPGFYRLRSRSAPHNVYADPAVLLAQADARHQAAPGPQFQFAAPGQVATAAAAGTPTNVVELKLSGVSRPTWTWSQAAGAWLRSEGAEPAVGADGIPLRATNVVVLRVSIDNDTGFSDPAGNPVPETRLVGWGEALLATGGRTVPVTWTKNAITSAVVLTGADGRPAQLAPGNTWVELVPTATGSVAVG